MDKNLLSPYIRVAMHSTIPAPVSISRRIIYDYEIIFVKDGCCRMCIDGKDYICRKNNVIFLRPGIPHSFHSYKDYDFVQPHIHFDVIYNENSHITPISFKDKDSMTENELKLVQEDILGGIDIPYVFVPENTSVFQNIFFNIIELFQSGKQNFELLYKSEMLRLLSLILNQFEVAGAIPSSCGFTVNSIKNYIDSNFLQKITLSSLAKQFHINKFTMMRQFKLSYGKNIIEYYNEKRLETAVHMLKTTNLSVKSIGDVLNFEDSYSFSRFFKGHTGVSPHKYRKLPYALEKTIKRDKFTSGGAI